MSDLTKAIERLKRAMSALDGRLRASRRKLPRAGLRSPCRCEVEIQRLRNALRQIEDFEHRGETIKDAFDEIHGRGSWERLFSTDKQCIDKP